MLTAAYIAGLGQGRNTFSAAWEFAQRLCPRSFPSGNFGKKRPLPSLPAARAGRAGGRHASRPPIFSIAF